MRARGALAALALLLVSCSSGGIGAGTTTSPPSTTPPASTTTSAPGGLSAADRAAAAAAAADFLGAWAAFDWALAAQFVTGPPAGFTETQASWVASLGVEAASFAVEEARPAEEGAGAVVGFEAALEIGGAGTWQYEGSLSLVRGGGRWLVDWTPSALYPTLEEGDTLRLVRTWPTRGALLAVDGRPIAAEQPVMEVGVVPERIEDQAALLAGLGAAGIDPEAALAEIDRPGVQPDWFVPVGTFEMEDYPAVAAGLEALPGVMVRESSERVALPSPFADQLVGFTGPITAELLARLGPPYGPADVVGRGGLELALEATLAGRPDQEIRRINHFGRMVEVLARFPGTAPQDVITTLDIDIQSAVEAVIAAAPEPAAIVVLDASSGGIRAAASRPLNSFDRALGGLYPPGSTFKVVTTVALLGKGITPDQEVDCPEQVTVGGRIFTNAGEAAHGLIPFAEAFAYSCNTTFAPLGAALLDTGELAAAAAGFGFGTAPGVPVAASTATFPEPVDTAEEAAAAIGQGRVLASPLHMASVAAAVAAGEWHSPTLIDGPAPAGTPLPAGAAAVLADLMRQVVEYGTGTAGAVEGQDVRGKTGTAEYEENGELRTHAWFIGYWQGYAFAVLVEGGGGGGRVAAPLAADLVERLTALPGEPAGGG